MRTKNQDEKMKKELEKYMSTVEPRFAVKRWKGAILELLEDGYTHKQIHDFLKIVGVKIATRTLSTYIVSISKNIEVDSTNSTENESI